MASMEKMGVFCYWLALGLVSRRQVYSSAKDVETWFFRRSLERWPHEDP